MFSTVAIFCLLNLFTKSNGHNAAILEIPENEQIDYEISMRLWNNISSAWCTDEDIPLKALKQAYECFRMNRGELEYNLQIMCERKIFPLTYSKNEIRRSMCRLQPEILAKFEKCYAEGGENTTAEIEEDAHLLDKDRHHKRVKEFHQFERLVACMNTAFGWDNGQISLVKPLPPNMWRSYVGTGLEKTLHANGVDDSEYESVDFDDYA